MPDPADRPNAPVTYADAGVDINAGNALVRAIKPLVAATRRPGADGEIGGFGGLFDLKAAGFDDPILVAANDGVGTKLRIAIETGMHDTIGIDLVAMCVNDLIVQGAESLFFLDYFATGKLETGVAENVIKGIAEGCQQAGCALIGGETAEMPGMYAEGDYDLAGFAVGAAERGQLLPRADIQPGDALIGLMSSGVHSNGYSLVRRLVSDAGLAWDAPAPFATEQTLAEALLTPTRIYVKPLLAAIRETGAIKALAHITGGGLTENIPRVLPHGVQAEIDLDRWHAPAVFDWLKAQSRLDDAEMLRTFNCGIGMVAAVEADRLQDVIAQLNAAGETVVQIGRLSAQSGDEQDPLRRETRAVTAPRKRVAILISGRGSNMQALVAAARTSDYPAEIVAVISNRPDAPGLAWAREQGIPTHAVDHKAYPSREAFEADLQAALDTANAELVALAGFMRLMTAGFVERWRGAMINIHPSLLPAFKGLDTHARALEAGVRIAGCTVHFVTPGMDEGPIIAQAAVPVAPDDTPDSLAARILKAEHELYPQALRWVAEGRITFENATRPAGLNINQHDVLISPAGP